MRKLVCSLVTAGALALSVLTPAAAQQGDPGQGDGPGEGRAFGQAVAACARAKHGDRGPGDPGPGDRGPDANPVECAELLGFERGQGRGEGPFS